MGIFDKAFAQEIAALIAEVGQSVSIKRQGASVTSGKGVFISSRSENITSSRLPGVSNAASTMKTLLLQATVSKPPLVGDDVVSSQGTFRVMTVSVTNPAGIAIIYKLECV
jgi:hypothetical protein